MSRPEHTSHPESEPVVPTGRLDRPPVADGSSEATWPRLYRLTGWMSAALAAVLLVLVGVAVAGEAGAVAVALLLSSLALVVASWPSAERLTRPRRARPEPDPTNAFHSYLDIVFGLGWGVDRGDWFRHRVLVRLVAALLADRRGVDLYDDPAGARRALGEDAWRVIDETLHPGGSDGGALTLEAATELVSRLEHL